MTGSMLLATAGLEGMYGKLSLIAVRRGVYLNVPLPA